VPKLRTRFEVRGIDKVREDPPKLTPKLNKKYHLLTTEQKLIGLKQSRVMFKPDSFSAGEICKFVYKIIMCLRVENYEFLKPE
jgi:hypothetical protein